MTRPTLRVTDLERFALEQVWRPYWRQRPEFDGVNDGSRLKKLPKSIEVTAAELAIQSTWSDLVIGRLAKCRPAFEFAPYVVHPLVDVVRERVAACREAGRRVEVSA